MSSNNNSKADSEFTIFSYNFFLLPTFVQPSSLKSERVELLCERYLGRYDVVCLQEAWFDWIRGRQQQLISKAKTVGGMNYCAQGPTANIWQLMKGYLSDSGLVTLSKYTIVRQARLIYSDSCGIPERYVANGVGYALIEMKPGIRLHVFNTHLQSDNHGYDMTPGRNKKVRRKQLEQLRDFVMLHSRSTEEDLSHSSILCGDLNVDVRNPEMQDEYREMIQLLEMDDAFSSQPRPPTLGEVVTDDFGNKTAAETWLTGPDDRMSEQCVDYILYRAGNGKAGEHLKPKKIQIQKCAVEYKNLKQLSDHLGIELTMGC